MSLLVAKKPKPTYYAQSESTEATELVAFANLLKKFGVDVTPAGIRHNLNLQGIAQCTPESIRIAYPNLVHVETDRNNSWPPVSEAVVTFRNDDGSHLTCVVGNWVKGTVIDSRDATEKEASEFGEIVSWTSYSYVEPEEEIVEPPAPEASDNRVYTISKRDGSIWGATRELKKRGINLTAEELAEHNGIEEKEMINVQPGFVLHLPIPHKKPEPPTTQYMLYDTPKLMHISHDGGARKLSFGNVRDIKDIKPTGPTYKQGLEVKIVAEAHVPVVDTGEDKILRFDMDVNAFKDGKVIQTIGYNWTHLTDGIYPPSEMPVQDPPQEEEEETKAEEKPDIVVEKPKLPWKEQFALTYNPFSTGALWFTAKEDMLVKDMATVRQPRKLEKGQDVLLAGTFRLDGKLYGNPQTGADNGLAWAVPMHKLVEKIEETAEDKALYTVNEKPLKLNFHFGRLTAGEKLVAEPLVKVETYGTKALRLISKKIKTNKRNK